MSYMNMYMHCFFKFSEHGNLCIKTVFRQLRVFGSLLSNIFIDDFAARQYKNCVRILKGSYIVMKG